MKHLILCLLFITSAHAADPVSVESGAAQVDRFMNGLQSMQANFTQIIKDSKDQVVETSTGTLVIKKPGKFRWEYLKPNAQTIVSDGTRVWLYDPELEQVTIRRADLSINGTPAVLLSGQGNWRDSFEVSHVELRGKATVVELQPKKADSDFRRVSLALQKDELVAMALSDKLGQTTMLDFRQFKRNGSVADSQFKFSPPKGADVIDNTAGR